MPLRLPLLLVPMLCMLAACDRQPGFNERYTSEEKRIGAMANSVEKQVAQEMTGAAEAERAAAEISGPAANGTRAQ